MRKRLLAAIALSLATPAAGDNLAITKVATVISDPLGYTVTPRSLPGAVVDYVVTYDNPSGNLLTPVRNMVTTDSLPAKVILRVTDIAAVGKGPVEFIDGGLLGLGSSGLAYTFTSLSSAADGIDFSNGSTWTYTPQPDAAGYDANVRAIRIRTTSTFAAGTKFQIRYRVKIR